MVISTDRVPWDCRIFAYSHAHIVGSQPSLGRGVAWAQSCMINRPGPGEDLEKTIKDICNRDSFIKPRR